MITQNKKPSELPLYMYNILSSHWKTLVALMFVVCTASFVVTRSTSEKSAPPNSTDISKVQNTHRVRFFEEKMFLEGVALAKKTKLPNLNGQKIVGGITPHHLLPATLLSRFFSTISTNEPITIVVIGPNHNEFGKFPVITSKYAWKTPFGVVQTDLKLLDALKTSSLVGVDEEVLPTDHATTGSLPYIKYYLPNAQVVQLLISNKMSSEQVEQLVAHLNAAIPSNTLIISAIDFSHYLNSKQASEKDILTEKLINTRDYEKIMKLNNDYTDSPVPLTVFLKLMDARETKKTVMLDHTNSGELLNDENGLATSYFSMVFVR